MSVAAVLLGVSEPTLYKLKKQLMKNINSVAKSEYQV
jgi:hypothetical protein